MPVLWRPLLIPIAALLALSGCGGDEQPGARPLQPIGLYTSLPILWRETGDLSGLLDTERPQHWALDVLGKHGNVRPLDDLSGSGGGLPLRTGALLVLAQPRPLSPDENVALDSWVRSGGRVLLFADPMLTGHSDYALGDNRRPQDIVLLSPILARWGLELHFDEAQPGGEHEVQALGQAIPVNLAGRFTKSGVSQDCAILADGLAARCRIGEGLVLGLADAALLEEVPSEELPPRRETLDRLIASVILREDAGARRDSE